MKLTIKEIKIKDILILIKILKEKELNLNNKISKIIMMNKIEGKIFKLFRKRKLITQYKTNKLNKNNNIKFKKNHKPRLNK
jgi:hypothetical protein